MCGFVAAIAYISSIPNRNYDFFTPACSVQRRQRSDLLGFEAIRQAAVCCQGVAIDSPLPSRGELIAVRVRESTDAVARAIRVQM